MEGGSGGAATTGRGEFGTRGPNAATGVTDDQGSALPCATSAAIQEGSSRGRHSDAPLFARAAVSLTRQMAMSRGLSHHIITFVGRRATTSGNEKTFEATLFRRERSAAPLNIEGDAFHSLQTASRCARRKDMAEKQRAATGTFQPFSQNQTVRRARKSVSRYGELRHGERRRHYVHAEKRRRRFCTAPIRGTFTSRGLAAEKLRPAVLEGMNGARGDR